MDRRRVASLGVTAALLGCATFGGSACGLLLTHGPPTGYQGMSSFSCTHSNTKPLLDVVWAGLNLAGAAELYASKGFGNLGGHIDVGTLAVYAVSGIVGLNRTGQCRAAEQQWASRHATERTPGQTRLSAAPSGPTAPSDKSPSIAVTQQAAPTVAAPADVAPRPPAAPRATLTPPTVPGVSPPRPVVAPAGGLMVLHNAFRQNSAVLQPTAMADLNPMASAIRASPNSIFEIGGYTSSVGTAERNLQVSQERADAVKAYFVSKGVPASSLTAVGYGAQHPVASNRTADGRAQNMRVEIRRLAAAAPEAPTAAPVVAPAGGLMVLHNAFRQNSAVLLPTAMADLDRIAGGILAAPNWAWEIGGYTSRVGTAARNQEVSQQRADAVKTYLVSKGVPAASMTAVGYGAQHPVASNRTAAGRAQNMRVEIKRLPTAGSRGES